MASRASSLKYRLSPIATVRSSSTRHLHPLKSKRGKFRSDGDIELSPEPDSKTNFCVLFTLKVVGLDEGSESLAFEASCTVETIAKFEQPINEDAIPLHVVEAMTTGLFFTAAERCRGMIAAMGYPSSEAASNPPRISPTEVAPSTASKQPVQKTRATPATRAKRSKG